MSECSRLSGPIAKLLVMAISLLLFVNLAAAEPIVEFAKAIEKGDLKIVKEMLRYFLKNNAPTELVDLGGINRSLFCGGLKS